MRGQSCEQSVAITMLLSPIGGGGCQVFIVTERELVRVDFNPTTQKLAYVWGANYGKQEGW